MVRCDSVQGEGAAPWEVRVCLGLIDASGCTAQLGSRAGRRRSTVAASVARGGALPLEGCVGQDGCDLNFAI